jgi:hypothetical protein
MATRLTKLSFTPIKQSFLFAVFLMISMASYSQISVDAGSDTTFCAGPYFSDTMFIGKNAKIKNAIEPYSVSWNCKVPLGLNSYLTASSILNDTKIVSPYIVFGPTITDSIKFYLTVSDHEGNFVTDSVCVHFSFYPLTNDYQVIYLSKGDSVLLNGGIAEGETDSIYWQPKEGLSNPDQASTWCKPDTTTDYYFIKVDPFGCACPHLTYVVRVLPETNDNKPEFAPIGAKWYFNYPNSTSNDYVVFESKKDTTIQGKDSRAIDVWLNNTKLVSREYVYQKGDSIFYYNRNYNSFFLLYNFSAKAGDTVTVHPAKFKPTKAFFSYNDSIPEFKYKILSIDSIQISGQWTKRQKVTLLKNGLWGFSKPDGKDYYILDKIGSLAYFFGVQSGITPEDKLSICRCYSDSDFDFKNPLWDSECDLISAVIDSKILNNNLVYPNPANTYITISIPSNIEIKKIEMFDFSGRVVQQWEAQELAGNQLNIQHILPGIYLLKAETNAGFKTEKLVVR